LEHVKDHYKLEKEWNTTLKKKIWGCEKKWREKKYMKNKISNAYRAYLGRSSF